MSDKTNQTEFKNDHLTVALSQEPGSIAKLNVVVSPLATQAAYEKAIKSINKEISLPGFRKGKAPRELVVQKYGKHIENEQREILINTSFQEALQLIKMSPFSNESIKLTQFKSMSNDKGSEFAIQFEAYPVVPTVDPKAIALNHIAEDPVEESKIDAAVQELRLWHAEWVDAPERAIAENDYVDLDIDLLEDEEKNLCKGTRFEVKKDKMGNWMRKLVIGKKAGDVVEGMSEKETKDDDCQGCDNPEHHHHHAPFKPTKCRITIKAVKEPKLPELDDTFAGKVGLKKIDELRGKVQEDLQRQSKEKAQNAMRQQLDKKLLSDYPFEIPASIVEGEKEYRLQAKIEEMHEEGKADINEAEVEAKVVEEAKEAYRLFFLMNKVIKDNNLQASKEDVMREYVRQMYMPEGEAIINQQMDPEEIQKRLSSYVLNRKAKDFLVDQASVK